MKTIIAGSRTILDYQLVKKLIEQSDIPISEVVSGGAKGVDLLAERWANENNIPIKRFPAKWNDITVPGAVIKTNKWGKYNSMAGFQRNQLMADYGEALIAIQRNNSSGTKHMIQISEKAGLCVITYTI